MNKYIVLLRGINVSGKNKLPMQELRDLLNELGYQNVQTYIQSGNIILETVEKKTEIIQKIKKGIADTFGYNVPVIVKTVNEWEKAIAKYPFSIENPKIVAFVFLNQSTTETVIEIKGIQDDEYQIENDLVYIYCPNGFGRSKLTINVFEKKLNVIATSRNYNTTKKLLELAE
jgi:uncharacterized protein (DUF1697 family)